MFTLEVPCAGELEIKHSQFLCEVVPIDQFESRLAALRAAHPKANHHCTAERRFAADGQLREVGRDDGEPGGTAGRPMLRVLQGRELVDVGAIVVRYFGGVKLGAGGLTRAYGNAVNEALQNAPTVPYIVRVEAVLEATFDRSDIVERAIRDNGLEVLARDFTSTGVRVQVLGAEEAIATARAAISPW